MNKVWVLYLKDGSYVQVKADDKNEAKKMAWEQFRIAWYDIMKFELYYK